MIAKIGRITLRTFIVILVFLIIIVLILDRLVEFGMDGAGLNAFFHAKNLQPHISYYQSKGRTVRYLGVGDQSKATVLFIHGPPRPPSNCKGDLSDTSLLARAT